MTNFFVWENLNHHQSKWMFLLCKSMNVSVKIVFLEILRRYMSHMIISQFHYWMLGNSKSDVRLMSKDVLWFTETQLKHQHSLNGIEQDFGNFRIFFNNNYKFLSLAYVIQKDMTLITQEDFPGVWICNFRKSSFISVLLKPMVLHKLNNQSINHWWRSMIIYIILYKQ